MTNEQMLRRILIVDDQQEIHDTFDRIFAAKRTDDDCTFRFRIAILESSGMTNRVRLAQQAKCCRSTNSITPIVANRQSKWLQAAIEAGTEYAVAFVDMRMPSGMDGMETTETALGNRSRSARGHLHGVQRSHVGRRARRLGYNDRLLLLKKAVRVR